jgi:hypothetical protein
MVGAGPANTSVYWRGDADKHTLRIVNASYSEFSNFGITPADNMFLKLRILVTASENAKFASTHNIFKNLGISSVWDDLGSGIQIGTSAAFDLRNDSHMFLNTTVSNFIEAAVNNLFFYNLLAAAPAVSAVPLLCRRHT